MSSAGDGHDQSAELATDDEAATGNEENKVIRDFEERKQNGNYDVTVRMRRMAGARVNPQLSGGAAAASIGRGSGCAGNRGEREPHEHASLKAGRLTGKPLRAQRYAINRRSG